MADVLYVEQFLKTLCRVSACYLSLSRLSGLFQLAFEAFRRLPRLPRHEVDRAGVRVRERELPRRHCRRLPPPNEEGARKSESIETGGGRSWGRNMVKHDGIVNDMSNAQRPV